MKTHTTIGASILDKPKSAILECARVIALTHHEQWDGLGYPQRLAGEAIPLAGRIVRLVDVFDALVSSRPYKEPYPLDVAMGIIARGRQTHFDPVLVDLLQANLDEVMRLRGTMGECERAREQFVWSERDDVYQQGL
jgi:putative two-component system response regulator